MSKTHRIVYASRRLMIIPGIIIGSLVFVVAFVIFVFGIHVMDVLLHRKFIYSQALVLFIHFKDFRMIFR